MNDDNWTPFKPGGGIRAVIGMAVIWAFIVVASGVIIFARTGHFDYQVTGQFGDSFGFIGALMASTAAYYAYRTYRAQSEETRILRDERKEAARLRAEPSFMALLERRYDTFDQLTWATEYKGPDAATNMARSLEDQFRSNQRSFSEAMNQTFQYARNYEQYFRTVYHIVRFAERQFEGSNDDKRVITRDHLSYHYVKLLRSQLTDAELFLLALNVLSPAGAGAKHLYERYALFHNLSSARMAIVQRLGDWDERAFGLPPEEPKPPA